MTKADAARVPGYAADKSNPNAQRVMADPEWRKAHTAISSDFIEGYYKNSRLHHLSTWKAELKHLVQEAQERAQFASSKSGQTTKVGSDFRAGDGGDKLSMRGTELIMKSPTSKSKRKGKAKAVEDDERVIMHCDFDCFFVAAGLVSRPELKGKPVVVCHSQGNQGGGSSTSEIASSSYEARKFGIKNGMRWVIPHFSFPRLA
jgi:DNA repair protein REV1